MSITIKSKQQIEYMKKAGMIVAEALEMAKENIRPGISTLELDKIIEDYIVKNGAKPSFKGYNGFPASSCISINNEIIHGIPNSTELKDGDIVSIDIGACINGYHGDAANTFPVGDVTLEAKKLIQVTKESFFEGIKFAKEGYRLYDISNAIQKHVEGNGFSIVKDFVGHGIGVNLHEEPQIPNYGPSGHGPRLISGMTLAIEPMVNQGCFETKILANKWTVVTRDGSLSAHYENTILITEDQPEILTQLR